jgi:MinD superfamily P-loop ATPase
VVETIRGADFVILVTEPTPFGFHDLELAVRVVQAMAIPCGVIINRDGVGDVRVERFCEENELPILMRIPLERRIGETIAQGHALVEALPEYRDKFRLLFDRVVDLLSADADCQTRGVPLRK